MAIGTPNSRMPLVAIVLVAVLFSACGGGQASTASVAPSPTPSPSVAAFAPSVTAVPSAPSATPLPSTTPRPLATPAAWERYTSTKYHYEIEYPPFWKVWPAKGTESDMIDHSGYPQIFMSRFVDSGTVSLDLTVKGSNAWYRSHYSTKLVKDKDVKVAGYRGRLITYTGLDGAVKVTIVSLLLAKGRVLYDFSIVGESANAVDDAAVFKRVYGSFKPT